MNSRRAQRQLESGSTSLYVRNLDEKVTDDVLLKTFSPFGKITCAKVLLGVISKKRFGFVAYAKCEEAAAALMEMNEKKLLGKPLQIITALRSRHASNVLTNKRKQLADEHNAQAASCSTSHGFPLQDIAQVPLSASLLANTPIHERKQLVGEYLYPLVRDMYPDSAGKITGMLLEMDISEVLLMMEEPDYLKAMVEDAVATLQNFPASS